ncbi:MAG: hypothetical protein ACRD07_10840 [Acidimicrobiales bacterium]
MATEQVGFLARLGAWAGRRAEPGLWISLVGAGCALAVPGAGLVAMVLLAFQLIEEPFSAGFEATFVDESPFVPDEPFVVASLAAIPAGIAFLGEDLEAATDEGWRPPSPLPPPPPS